MTTTKVLLTVGVIALAGTATWYFVSYRPKHKKDAPKGK